MLACCARFFGRRDEQDDEEEDYNILETFLDMLNQHRKEIEYQCDLAFLCPKSGKLMVDPVEVVQTGRIYDRCSIQAHFARQRFLGQPLSDPVTEQELTLIAGEDRKLLKPDKALRARIYAYLQAFQQNLLQSHLMAHRY